MSALRSAIQELANENLDDLHVDQLADDLVEIELVSGLLETQRVRRLSVYGSKGGPLSHGFSSPTAFLKTRCRMAAGRARRLVAASIAIGRAKEIFRAWCDGRLSSDQAGRLFETSEAVHQEFVAIESTLVDAVDGLSVSDTRRLLDYWRQSVDGPGTVADEIKQDQARGVSLSLTMGGMARIDGWLTTTAGEALATALDSLMPPPSPDDPRPPRQRRHDALEDLARGFLDHGETPVVGGEKPHINIVCDLDALQGVAGGVHETETGQVVTVATLRRVACDSSVARIILGPASEVVDVGRRTRSIPAGMRRAVIVRDRHCTWKGCDRKPRWCDVHHKKHWADGGETGLENLTLLCRFHHTLMHRGYGQRRGPPPTTHRSGRRPAHRVRPAQSTARRY